MIVSEVLEPIVAHMNLQLGRDRYGTGSMFVSLIVEGDEALALRPVAELTERAELDAAPSYSALGGARGASFAIAMIAGDSPESERNGQLTSSTPEY